MTDNVGAWLVSAVAGGIVAALVLLAASEVVGWLVVRALGLS